MTNDRDEFFELRTHPGAIALFRAREKGDGATGVPRIPLTCSGHKTGIALVVYIRSEVDEGTPVPDHLDMYTVPDVKADKPGTAKEDEPRPVDWSKHWSQAIDEDVRHQANTGNSFTIRCGTCGRSIRRRKVKLLRDAIERVVNSGKNSYRISIT